MPEFKCISCGNVEEREEAGSCPVCGYRMFKTPYERKKILISEIENFITRLEVRTVMREDLVFEGKEKDDKRFPSYDKILRYVSGADKTEAFLDNLLETCNQLKMHFASQFSKSYPISFDNLNGIMEEYDIVLTEAANVTAPGFSFELKPVEWGVCSLIYSENPNRYLWLSAKELIDLIEKLSKKIVRFIKINNLYGDKHKYHPNRISWKFKEGSDYKEELENAISEMETVLAKQYIVDIMDDGFDELKEMLTCLWHSIELIMCAPLFIHNYDYMVESEGMTESEFFERLSDILSNRYADFNEAITIATVLSEKSEEELFDLYKELIGVDKFGFLIPAGTELINIGESEKKLNKLIGLGGIKESIQKIKAYALANKDSKDLNIHMCFMGNPGSGKTEVARYIAEILYENKILPTKQIVEVDRSGLVSQYFGATAEKTSRVISKAMGGVLFVDEAYALGNNSDSEGLTDYGKEAIDTLVKAMEDHRGEFCVILAGYKNEMEKMLATNPGFRSRIQFTLDFPNYSRDELRSITELMLNDRGYTFSDGVMDKVLDITEIRRKDPNFANAREIRNILDQVIMNQNLRCLGTNDKEIGLVDVNKYIKDFKLNMPTVGEGTAAKVLTGEEELDQLIGLASVKRMVKKIRAYAKKNQGEADFNLHMCFYGNPGTGKTEVARILSRILHDAGVLDEAKLVETDSHGLIGKYVGETGPKTEKKVNEAMGGVLFIDEAYALTESANGVQNSSSYGAEAIAVLLKEMEDKRGQFCAILAGYKDEMKAMLSSNPGFESRIQFTLEFPDYTREELGEIAIRFLGNKKYEIEDDALDRVLDITEYFRGKSNFANARTIRNILDQVIMNQNLRTEDDLDNDTIVLCDVEDYLVDEGIDLEKPAEKKRTIGFI